MAGLGLALLGGFEAHTGGGTPLVVPTRKAQALLAYLALTPRQAHPRDKLASLLWPDARPGAARNALRQTLFVVRKALGHTESPIVMSGDAIGLGVDAVQTDVAAFEQAANDGSPAALERAATLYRGDLLAGVGTVAPTFEDWLMSERERLRELALEALARLLAHQRSAGAMAGAVQTALRLLALDPLQEPVHRTLMRLYVQLGRRDAALRQYQECVAALQRDLALEPEAATQELYQDILRQRPALVPTSSIAAGRADTPLVGRQAETKDLRAALADAWTGRGHTVAVVGEAGVGKSRLLAELAAEAGHRSGAVLLGRCYETERGLPFGPWVAALRDAGVLTDARILEDLEATWRAQLSRLLPELGEPERSADVADPGQLRLFEALAQFVRGVAVAQPLAILIEDVHWADDTTLRFLAYFGRRLRTAPILVVVSAREEDLGDRPLLRSTLDELTAEQRLRVLTLRRLEHDDTLALTRLLTGGSSRAALRQLGEQIWEASAGNPFIVIETLRAIGDGIALPPSGGLPLPERVRAMIVRRLDRLGAIARDVVSVAAVIGRPFDFALVQRATGLAEGETAAGIEELVRRRLIQDVGDRLEFTHDRIREVVATGLLASRRPLLHGAVAAALEQLTGDDPSRHAAALGTHYRAAGLWRKAAEFLRLAGHQATEQSAYREAVALLDQARAAIERLAPSPTALEQAIDVRLDLRNALLPLGDSATIVTRLEEAVTLADRLGDRARQVRALAFLIDQRRLTGEQGRVLSEGERALALAESLNDVELLVLIQTRLGQLRHLRGEYRQAAALFRRSLEVSNGISPRERLGLLQPPAVHSRYSLVGSLAELGAFEEAAAVADECLGIARSLDHPIALTFAWASAGNLALQRGEPGLAIERMERALAYGRSVGDTPWASRFTGLLGYAYALSAQATRGVTMIAQALEQAAATGITGARSLMLAWLAEALVLAGDADRALALAREAVALAERHGERGHIAWALRARAEAESHRRPTDPTGAARTYEQALALARELEMEPLARRCQLGVDRLRGRGGIPDA